MPGRPIEQARFDQLRTTVTVHWMKVKGWNACHRVVMSRMVRHRVVICRMAHHRVVIGRMVRHRVVIGRMARHRVVIGRMVGQISRSSKHVLICAVANEWDLVQTVLDFKRASREISIEDSDQLWLYTSRNVEVEPKHICELAILPFDRQNWLLRNIIFIWWNE